LQRILDSGLLRNQLFRGYFRVGDGKELLSLLPRVEAETLPAMRDGRLAEPDADRKKVLKVGFGKVRVALCQVVDGLFHPMLLILSLGLEDATTIDVTEEFVSGPSDHVFFRHIILLL
jgi:hypothetical protein